MRAVKIIFAVAFLSLAASVPACSCADSSRSGRFDLGGDCNFQIGTISVTPADVTLDLTSVGAPQSQQFQVTFHGPKSDQDVTNDLATIYNLADPTIGTMGAAGSALQGQFTTGTDHGGTTQLVVNYTPPAGEALTGTATIHVKVHGAFNNNCNGMPCPTFPPDNAPQCAAGAAPTLVYPTDGVLLPPNLETLDVQFTSGSGDTSYEIDFTNSNTDVRAAIPCTPVQDTRGVTVPNGCSFVLDPMLWDFIAKSNKGGDPITVTVRASTDGNCASGSNSEKMSIAEQDIAGGVYYWKSTVTAQGTGGEIWRKDFGNANPEERISPSSGSGFSATCYGCHSLSRDGLRMTLSADDSDSDDEYSDVSMGLVDVGSKMFITMIAYDQGQAAGFQTFNNDHSLYIGSNGCGDGSNMAGGGCFGGAGGTTNQFFVWDGNTGANANPGSVNNVGSGGARPTMPDWSIDNKNVVFVMPQVTGWSDGFGGTRPDDTHVYGGSLWILPYNGNNSWGTATPLVMSNGDNNYYPSFSPDGNFILFNHVPKQGTGAVDACVGTATGPGTCPNDSFSNPKARVFLLAWQGTGAQPVDLELANGSPAASPVDVSNSWPRWSPFVQTYKGNKLLWVTFSSTRDYGLHVRNHVQVNGQAQIQCYPPDSAENPNGSHGDQFPANCQQPQIWMAAINLTATETNATADPSYPAFWLPFQDITTHNHAAQWTSQVVTMPQPDAGTCIMGGQDCTKNPTNCCTGICTGNGTCGVP